MPDPTPPPAPPGIRHLRLRVAFSAFFLLVFLAPLIAPRIVGDVEFKDYVPLLLVGLPWFGLFVSELKLPGGVEAKFAALQEEVKAAEAKAEAARAEAVEGKTEARLLAVSPPARADVQYGRAAAELFPPSIPPRRPRPADAGALSPPGDGKALPDFIQDWDFRPSPSPGNPAQAPSSSASMDAPQPMALSPDPALTQPPRPLQPVDVLSALRRLAAAYNRVRAAEPAGPSRTAAMTAVVRDMVAVAGLDVSGKGIAIPGPSDDDDEGLRLAAAAWAFAHPAQARTLPLVDALYATTHHFVQYWLMVALDRVAGVQGKAGFSQASRDRLAALAGKLEPGSDRHAVVTSLLRRIGAS